MKNVYSKMVTVKAFAFARGISYSQLFDTPVNFSGLLLSAYNTHLAELSLCIIVSQTTLDGQEDASKYQSLFASNATILTVLASFSHLAGSCFLLHANFLPFDDTIFFVVQYPTTFWRIYKHW